MLNKGLMSKPQRKTLKKIQDIYETGDDINISRTLEDHYYFTSSPKRGQTDKLKSGQDYISYKQCITEPTINQSYRFNEAVVSEKRITKKKPQINYDFLKCYWKKDYQELTKGIERENYKCDKELPFLVSSYSKDPKIIKTVQSIHLGLVKQSQNNLKDKNYIAQGCTSQNPGPLISTILPIKSPTKQLQHLIPPLKHSDTMNSSQIDYKKKSTLFNEMEKTFRESKNNTSGHVFKGSNLKLNLMKNTYKNLDSLLEQNNIFYLNYQGLGGRGNFNNEEFDSLIDGRLTQKKTFNKVTKNTKLQENYYEFPTFLKEKQQNPNVSNILSPISEQILDQQIQPQLFPPIKTLLLESDSEIEEVQDEVKDSVRKWKFQTLQTNLLVRYERSSPMPNILLMIHVDGLLGFVQDSFFGFQQDNLPFAVMNELQSQLSRLFNTIVIGQNEQNVFYVYKQINDILKNLNRAYIIILIMDQKNHNIHQPFINYLRDKKIFYDAMYSYECQDRRFVMDYDTILNDFKISLPKLIIVANSIDLEDVQLIHTNSHQRKQSQKFRLIQHSSCIKPDQYAQNIKMLKQVCLDADSLCILKGVFPRSSLKDPHKIRTILFSRLTYRGLLQMAKFNKQIPNLDKLEQISIALMNDYSFLNFIYKNKQSLFRCSFNNMMEKYYQSEIIGIKAKHTQISDKLKTNRILVNQSDFFLPEQAEQAIAESKRHIFTELNLKIHQVQKRNIFKRQLDEFGGKRDDIQNDVHQKLQALIEELYLKNQSIFKQILKQRMIYKSKIQDYIEQEYIDDFVEEEIEFCSQYNDLILYWM